MVVLVVVVVVVVVMVMVMVIITKRIRLGGKLQKNAMGQHTGQLCPCFSLVSSALVSPWLVMPLFLLG